MMCPNPYRRSADTPRTKPHNVSVLYSRARTVYPLLQTSFLFQCAPTAYGPGPSARVKGENFMRSRQPALAQQTSSDPWSRQLRSRSVWQMLFILSVAINLLGICGLGYVVYKNKSYITNWYGRKIRGISRESGARQWKYEAYRQKTMIFSASNDMLINKPLVVFVGDSFTNGFPWNEWLLEETRAVIVNRASDGATVDWLSNRFESIFPPNPHIQKTFIMIGISDILAGEFQLNTFIDKYRMLLEKILSITTPGRICVLSILPTRKENLLNVTIQLDFGHCESAGGWDVPDD
jgi:hypothetical protein